jgi:hypothetical protein
MLGRHSVSFLHLTKSKKERGGYGGKQTGGEEEDESEGRYARVER